MPETNKYPRIDELSNRRFIGLLCIGLAFMGGCSFIIFGVSASAFDETTLNVLKVFMAISMVMYLALLLRCLFCRVCIDETGVEATIPLGGHVRFRWEEIRTAAIVRLTVGTQTTDPLILLSIREPEETLTSQALTGRHGLKKHEHVRIPCTDARRACVEHYLHMTLPEYRL